MRCLMRIVGCAAVLLLLGAARGVAEDRAYTEGTHGKGSLRYVGGIPVVTLVGTPEQIGGQEAALVLGVARPLLGLPRQILEDRVASVGWPVVAGLGQGMVARGPERYRRELDAAAAEAGLAADEKDAFVIANAMIELRRIGGCSALLVEPSRSETGGMLFGRNFDFPTFGHLDRLGIVSLVRPEGKKAFAAVGFPGLVGVVSGMNEDGLAVATLDVYSSKDGSPMFDPLGVPLALTYREILEECSTVAEAETLLKGRQHTTWMNLACCDEERAVVFEISTKGVMTRPAVEGVTTCTNHFRTPELCTSKECWRFDAITAVAGSKPQLGLPDVRKALHAANQGEFTIQSMVFEPAPRVLHVALGKPPVTAKPLVRLDLKPFFEAADN